MTISILLPVKNAAPWISDTLRSIQAQDCADWELIAVDDHSQDNSFEIVKGFAAQDPRIQIVSNFGSGIVPALQGALKRAQGTFITRMDADDVMPPTRLRAMRDTLCTKGQGHVVTGCVRYFPEPVSPGYLKYAAWLNDRVQHGDHAQHLFRECVLASPNWMLFKEDADRHGLFEDLVYPEDYELVFRMHAAGLHFAGIPDVTLLWREHPMRTSRNSKVYEQASFFQLKLPWFFRLEMDAGQPLALFGAGLKGKLVARYLLDHQKPFRWYDMKAARFGAGIYGKEICDPATATEARAIVCVYPESTKDVEAFLSGLGYTIGSNAWYF